MVEVVVCMVVEVLVDDADDAGGEVVLVQAATVEAKITIATTTSMRIAFITLHTR